MKTEMWFTEKQTENVGITCKTSTTLHTETTDFQELVLIDTLQFGKMLVLDGAVQTTEFDEFVYHEMITHIPLFTHNNPKKALVVGGGDGGAIREILKHPSIEKAVLVEIDGRVVELCKEHLPTISCALSDSRAEVLIEDGIKYIQDHKNEFDVIIVDSTDPVGPAVGLFAIDFYKAIYESLKDDGIFVAQTESPFYHQSLIKRVYKDIESVFPVTRLYLGSIPTYPSGLMCFTMGSKKYDPLQTNVDDKVDIETKYYTKELHKTVFSLPRFVRDIIK